MLYQRYFLRMNQNNISHCLALLLVMTAALLVVQGYGGYLTQLKIVNSTTSLHSF